MDTADGLEFINRGAELRFLNDRLAQNSLRPALILLRSPSGFGKTSLTDALSHDRNIGRRVYCKIDPSVRGRTGSTSIRNGFFVQKAAESLNVMAESGDFSWPSLAEFMRKNRFKLIASKKKIEIFSEFPSAKHLYKVVFDYVSRAFFLGRFSAQKILSSDESEAILICEAYIESIIDRCQVVLIFREAHHFDLDSLKFFLLLNEKHPGPDLILEYTSNDGQCEPEHQRYLLRSAAERGYIDILDLVRLSREHLEYLIRKNVHQSYSLASDFYLSWDGNLRSVVELKFQVGIGRTLTDGAGIGRALTNLADTLTEHVRSLSTGERMILAIVLGHVEAIDRSILSEALSLVDPFAGGAQTTKALTHLEEVHSFIDSSKGQISIRSETVALALREVPAMHGMMGLAEKALRDYYAEILQSPNREKYRFSDSIRQYFRLCARTRDSNGLLLAVKKTI